MKKKIIFVTKALWIGGIETALVNLLNYFDYEKYDVTLLVLHAELDMKEQVNPKCRVMIADRERTYSFDEEYPYKRLFHLTERTEHPSKIHQAMMWTVPMIRWIENRLYIRYIRKMMKNEHFDTAVIYSDAVAEVGVRAINADKYIMFYHHGAMRHEYHDEIAYKKCEKIIAVSNNQAEELKKYVPKAKNKIIVIHNLTDVDGIRRKALQETMENFDDTKFNIVSVGRVSREKGMDIAVKVCARLVQDGFENIRWWIVGDGPAMKEVQDTIAETGMEKYVKLVGMKDNPYPYIGQADLYVQPSRFESFGLTIAEALALGKKVIATDTMGARENLIDTDYGVVCPNGIHEMARVIESEIENSKANRSEKTASDELKKKNKIVMKQLEMIL